MGRVTWPAAHARRRLRCRDRRRRRQTDHRLPGGGRGRSARAAPSCRGRAAVNVSASPLGAAGPPNWRSNVEQPVPAGAVEPGEAREETAVRETLGERGRPDTAAARGVHRLRGGNTSTSSWSTDRD
ncbi:NUDIX domain-containing protein [Streptomyces sp. NPDC004244]